MRKREDEHGAGVLSFMGCVLLAGVLALAVCIALLFLLSLLISSGHLSSAGLMRYTIAACAVSSFLGGLFAVSRYRVKVLLVGAGTGIVLFLLLLTAGFVLYTDVSLDNHGAGLFCAALLGGMLAGLIGGKQKKKRRK